MFRNYGKCSEKNSETEIKQIKRFEFNEKEEKLRFE